MFLVCSVFLAVASICLFHFFVTPRYIAVIASSSVWCVRKPLCPGGGGGTLIFSAYVGSDPASTVHPKKYQEFQAPQKNI